MFDTKFSYFIYFNYMKMVNPDNYTIDLKANPNYNQTERAEKSTRPRIARNKPHLVIAQYLNWLRILYLHIDKITTTKSQFFTALNSISKMSMSSVIIVYTCSILHKAIQVSTICNVISYVYSPEIIDARLTYKVQRELA